MSAAYPNNFPIILSAVLGGGKDKKPSGSQKIGTVSENPTEEKSSEKESGNKTSETEKSDSAPVKEGTEEKETAPVQTEYRVGDILMDGGMKIVYVASGVYTEENEFMQPKDGKQYIFMQFAFENTSSSDASISSFNFECYADGYNTEQHFGGDDDFSATLSSGRATTGFVYFEVPVDAESVEVEYETNIFTEKKIKFLYEGEKDSGYTPALDVKASADAYHVGQTAESSKLKITYLSCKETISDNVFLQPEEGNHFVTCEFEFENVGSSDESVSSLSFDCFADGMACAASYLLDDNLSATLSAGRKTKGTVTFEVPDAAEIVEVEYLSNYWTSKRVIFTVEY